MSNNSCAEREEGETPRTLSGAEVSGSRRCWGGLSPMSHPQAPSPAPVLPLPPHIWPHLPTATRELPVRSADAVELLRKSLPGVCASNTDSGLVRAKYSEETQCPVWWKVPSWAYEVNSWFDNLLWRPWTKHHSQLYLKTIEVPSACSLWVVIFIVKVIWMQTWGLSLHDGWTLAGLVEDAQVVWGFAVMN